VKHLRRILIMLLVTGAFVGGLYYTHVIGLWPPRVFTDPLEGPEELHLRNDCMGEGHFGARRSGGRRKHKGVDLLAPVGTPVVAICRAKVLRTGNHNSGYGKFVELLHWDNSRSLYAHLSEISVKKGQVVSRGQVIGRVGKTGNAGHRLIKPHLHFEIIMDGKHVDPMEYIGTEAKPQGVKKQG